MQIKDIMSKDIQVVSPNTFVSEIARKMYQRDCGSVLVTEKDQLVGIITDRDLALRCLAESHRVAETKAAQVMTKEVLYCRDTDELGSVALYMTNNKVRRLAVLNADKRLVGVVSLGDLAVNSTDNGMCGKALGHICAVPGKASLAEENKRARAAQ